MCLGVFVGTDALPGERVGVNEANIAKRRLLLLLSLGILFIKALSRLPFLNLEEVLETRHFCRSGETPVLEYSLLAGFLIKVAADPFAPPISRR